MVFHTSEALSAIFMPKIEYRTTLLRNEERFSFSRENLQGGISMSTRTTIAPNDNSLSCEATGILSKMLNLPESDYLTAEELCPFFENDSLKTIRTALNELTDAGYLLRIGNTYAVNKLRITQMKLVWQETGGYDYGCQTEKDKDNTLTGVSCKQECQQYQYCVEYVGNKSKDSVTDYINFLESFGYQVFFKNINLNWNVDRAELRLWAEKGGRIATNSTTLHRELLIVEKRNDGKLFELHTTYEDKIRYYKQLRKPWLYMLLIYGMLGVFLKSIVVYVGNLFARWWYLFVLGILIILSIPTFIIFSISKKKSI